MGTAMVISPCFVVIAFIGQVIIDYLIISKHSDEACISPICRIITCGIMTFIQILGFCADSKCIRKYYFLIAVVTFVLDPIFIFLFGNFKRERFETADTLTIVDFFLTVLSTGVQHNIQHNCNTAKQQ